MLAEDFTRDAPLGRFDSVYPGWAGYAGARDTFRNGTYNSDRVVSVSDGVLDKYLHSVNGVARPTADRSAIPTDPMRWVLQT